MNKWFAVVSAGVIAGFGASAVADDDDHRHDNRQRVFRTQLSGFSEVPGVSSAAKGQFYAVVNSAGTAFTYWLTYSGFESAVTQAHIHFGQHHTNGGISVWLCQGTLREVPPPAMTDTPNCENGGTTMPISETIDAADVVGPNGQGISPGEFAELLAAMRAGVAYANVHSATFGPGEIRGQIK